MTLFSILARNAYRHVPSAADRDVGPLKHGQEEHISTSQAASSPDTTTVALESPAAETPMEEQVFDIVNHSHLHSPQQLKPQTTSDVLTYV